MKWLTNITQFAGGILLLLRDIFTELKTKPFYWNSLLRQIEEIGWKSIPIVFVTGACIGMILTLQFGFTLEKFGAKNSAAIILSLSIFTEGCVFTALVLAGKIGAGMAAEIGSMKITQQIDALLALGTSPIKKLVIPGVLGGLIAIPALSLFSCLISVLSGAMIGKFFLNIDILYFLRLVFFSTQLSDFLSGYIKTYFFSVFITLTACYFGLQATKGTYAVGNAVTKSVVYASVLIVMGRLYNDKNILDTNKMIPLISVKNLHISFNKKKILKGVTFDLTEGECLGLIGGSGEGKSTLLRSIIGLEQPTSGHIIVENENINSFTSQQFLSIRKKIAYVFQGGALFDSMTIYDNLAFPLREHTPWSENKIKKAITDELKEFELVGCTHQYPHELSGGMQKRVGIARATIIRPKVILYDEPTAGLDPYKKRNMENIIVKLQKRGTSSIIVTHDMQTTLKICNRIALLGEGKIQIIDTPQNFQTNHNKILQNFIKGIKGGNNAPK